MGPGPVFRERFFDAPAVFCGQKIGRPKNACCKKHGDGSCESKPLRPFCPVQSLFFFPGQVRHGRHSRSVGVRQTTPPCARRARAWDTPVASPTVSGGRGWLSQRSGEPSHRVRRALQEQIVFVWHLSASKKVIMCNFSHCKSLYDLGLYNRFWQPWLI